MDHGEIRHRLSEYMDGALEPAEQAAIEEHLETCIECSTALSDLRKTVDQIKAIGEVDSPAWMTQRIMAKVRSADEKKKGRFPRLFFPLPVKLPLEVLGVIFLAVMVYFIYQEPMQKAGEPEVQESFAKKKEAIPEKQAPPGDAGSQSVRQQPGYQGLDMKPEYGKPQPPPPAPKRAYRDEQAPEAQMRENAAPPAGLTAPEAGTEAAPSVEKKQAPAAAFAPRARAARPADGPEFPGLGLTLVVPDLTAAGARVEETIRQTGGHVTERRSIPGGVALTAHIDNTKRDELIRNLKGIGRVEVKDSNAAGHDDVLVVEITIVKQ